MASVMERQYQEELAAYEEELRVRSMQQRALEEAHRPQQQQSPPPHAQERATTPNLDAKELWHRRDLQRQAQAMQ